ncbi:DNA replication/repair protein RecF [Kineobactrum salinum]|uniref:DNA replication and repair protein RecF n=1 Tax=Kineobactrum salinum TaxID=2708301 RepID=A0A6C0U1F2_9GAMM|nr:DNA replication/repair protein RecF [Kineobactrum salinum]QIB65613.1 DNA replication/repair protein RecF [Kineobactrum salinum]
MAISQLQIHHIRNLQQLYLQELSQINIIYGANGSGKTSVLEAIHMLGMARSFRSGGSRAIVSHGQPRCTVFGVARSAAGGRGIPMAVQRAVGGEVEIKVAGQQVRSVAELAERLPLQVMNADSFGLLLGPPGLRRQFLNWGVFHVEHRFYPEWLRFQRCIKQRNKLLRRDKLGDGELAVWTRDLAVAGERINAFRLDYFSALAPRFREIMARLAPELEALELRFRPGWDRTLSYSEALDGSSRADRDQGYTHVGPQRADIRVTIGGYSAAETLSRGQQKLLVCGLKLAQGELMSELGGGHGGCVYLIDDLPSELDQPHCRLVCGELVRMKAQVFLSCVRREDLEGMWPTATALKLFHVEHGSLLPAIEDAASQNNDEEGPPWMAAYLIKQGPVKTLLPGAVTHEI